MELLDIFNVLVYWPLLVLALVIALALYVGWWKGKDR